MQSIIKALFFLDFAHQPRVTHPQGAFLTLKTPPTLSLSPHSEQEKEVSQAGEPSPREAHRDWGHPL